MAEFKHGTMAIEANEKTFHGFLRVVIWVGGIAIGVLVFLAIFNS